MQTRSTNFALPSHLYVLWAASLVWALVAPAEINGDGVGYLKALQGSQQVPGHPLFLLLARAWTSAFGPKQPLDAVWLLRGLSLGAATLAVALTAAAARRFMGGHVVALRATLFLGTSYGFIRAAHQVEVYAIATCAVALSLWALLHFTARRSPLHLLVAASAAALAALLHLTLTLLAIPLVVTAWRHPPAKWTHLAFCVASYIAIVAGGLWWAAQTAGQDTLMGAIRWYTSADHGISYPLSVKTPLVALWGFSRTLAGAPYLHQTAAPTAALALGALSIATMATLCGLRWRARRQAHPHGGLDPLALATWLLPLTVFGVLFFPSDTERWLFLWPALALWFSRARMPLIPILLGVAVVNCGIFAQHALDDTSPRRARRAEQHLRASDLLVSPGHGWTEQVGLGMARPPKLFPLIYFVGKHRSVDAAAARLKNQVSQQLADGRRVFVARLRDKTDLRGFKELSWFGFERRDYVGLFDGCSFRPTPVKGLMQLTRCRIKAPKPKAPAK